ncbi:MAG: Leucine-responsive regulatory protein [Paracidovorax wautersii]|uniref:Leucine-responsive regulatory protein n=1 Tax=Paracidovorax wautersii TaxID=1177982 RepID=A0A7V8FRF4_9BURK|nr:MAG: Leucine-responsive regulatory protein [Paracidovorax wautersii]
MIDLDDVDLRILRAIQTQGRATYDELAPQVGLSPSAVLRRIKRLEAEGVIAGYRAVIDPAAVGMALTAYITVRLEKHSVDARRTPLDQFRAAVQSWSEVIDCVSMTGEMDFLLRVVVRDMKHFSDFLSETLLRHPAVRDCRSSFVLESIKKEGGLAL